MNPLDRKPTTPPPPPTGTKPVSPVSNTVIHGATSAAPSPAQTVTETPTTSNDSNEGSEGDDKKGNRSKLFIVVGEIHEFDTAAKAEKFLNQPDAPAKFTVLRGHKVESKQRVSLRG